MIVLFIIIMLILLLVSDAGWIAITSISASFFSLVGLVVVALINKKVNTVKESIDGLLQEKSKADKKIGAEEEKDRTANKEAIGDERELKIRRDQDLKDQPPANRDSEIKDVKNQIVETLESQIHKKGEEMKKVVESKSDQIKQEVEKVPDEVVKKLPPQ